MSAKEAKAPFDAQEFPYTFLEAFGNKSTTIKLLRKGDANKSDIAGGVLQRNHIHMAVSPAGEVLHTLQSLKNSPATSRYKAKYVLATDGEELQAEDMHSGETIACAYKDFANHFGFFLPLSGISYTKEIKEVELDMKASSRLNRLYLELLKENPQWGTPQRRADMNHFMARLIFCFFAEDTNIFLGDNLFTNTIDQMSAKDGSDTHEVIGELFRAMNTPTSHAGKPDNRYRQAANIRSWANVFPYVNGGLFSGDTDVPRFSKIARTYLLHVGHLDWQKINPDIFGSMIQAVADDSERGALGMHYTSVPNILKVLNPLFLDDLRDKLGEVGDNPRRLLNLRKRMSRIRVFDPACGSGNFLVIAYKEMRTIEAEINKRRAEPDLRSEIPLTNFRGIELKHFPAEIARLALIIAEYQCDVQYRGQKEALAEFLPLDTQNWITYGNALRLNWLSLMGVDSGESSKHVKIFADDLFGAPLDQAAVDFSNEIGETYICGNPPYKGSKWQSAEQKSDLKAIFDNRTKNWKSLDYVAGWFMKAADYITHTQAEAAFVSTNSICQGHQVPILWPLVFNAANEIVFAHTSFKWANLASDNAGVTVVIVGIGKKSNKLKRIFSLADEDKTTLEKITDNINAYLIPAANIIVESQSKPSNNQQAIMQFGNHPYYGVSLIFSNADKQRIIAEDFNAAQFIRPIYGSNEFISSLARYCIWVTDDLAEQVLAIQPLKNRIDKTATDRAKSTQDSTAQKLAKMPHRFRDQYVANKHVIVVPGVSSENREYLPVGLLSSDCIISNTAFALYDAPLCNMALIASRLHLIWVASVCVRLEMRFRYSNTLGWNTFPVPFLTANNKAELTACAEKISCWHVKRISLPPSRIYMPLIPWQKIFATPTTATMKCWSAFISVAASKTIPNGWENCLTCTPK